MVSNEKPTALKQQILAAACRFFIKGGYNGFSMREVAEEINVSKPALYYHFKDKNDLILAVLVDCLDEYNHLIEENIEPPGSARQQLTRLVHAIFNLPPEKRAIIQVAGQEIVHLTPEARQFFNRQYHDKFIDKITQIIQSGIANKEFLDADPIMVTRIYLGMMFPFFHLSEENTLQACKLTLSIFFEGAIVHAKDNQSGPLAGS